MLFVPDTNDAELTDAAERLIDQLYSFEERRAIAANDEGWSREIWRKLGDFGLWHALLPDPAGLDFGARKLLPVMRAIGRSLLLEPYFETGVVAASLFAASDRSEEFLSMVERGEIISFVDLRSDAVSPARGEARLASDEALVSGDAINVGYGASCDWMIVATRTADGRDSVLLVAADQPGVNVVEHRLIDNTPSADVTLRDASASVLAIDDPASDMIARSRALADAARLAEALGVAEQALALTIEHVKTRVQFGGPLAAKQTVAHRIADMQVAIEQIHSAAILAAVAFDTPDQVERGDALRAAIATSSHLRSVCESAVQLHGAIGMTAEHAVGHHLARAIVLEQGLGDRDSLLGRLADELEESNEANG